MSDLDGDGEVSKWETHLCKLCLMGALALTFGQEAIALV